MGADGIDPSLLTDFLAEAIKAGVNNDVVKPFTPDGLSGRIMETLRRASQAA